MASRLYKMASKLSSSAASGRFGGRVAVVTGGASGKGAGYRWDAAIAIIIQ